MTDTEKQFFERLCKKCNIQRTSEHTKDEVVLRSTNCYCCLCQYDYLEVLIYYQLTNKGLTTNVMTLLVLMNYRKCK